MSTFFMPVRAWSLPGAAAESAINATLTRSWPVQVGAG
ncbi:hypothetical protein C8D87_104120 [Lentzea atacamensis]|uniref:Uncharacterized protein n=1 Tax=Lentzea atacamensis TaxID=531938 RepID=A0ABX9EA23_9PSEU|nr:hypothetical protein C8D87_104120 [Lentzea atacamensis]